LRKYFFTQCEINNENNRIEEIKASLIKPFNIGKLKADRFPCLNIDFRQNSDNWLW
jgi:hypothetical protein